MATPDLTPESRAKHTLLGALQLQINRTATDQPEHGYSNAIFSEDGTYLEYGEDPDFGVGICLWLVTGERSGAVVVNFQQLARTLDSLPEKDMFDSGYEPEANSFIFSLVNMHIRFNVLESGNALSATGTMQVRDENSHIIAGPFGAGDVSGTRLVAASP